MYGNIIQIYVPVGNQVTYDRGIIIISRSLAQISATAKTAKTANQATSPLIYGIICHYNAHIKSLPLLIPSAR